MKVLTKITNRLTATSVIIIAFSIRLTNVGEKVILTGDLEFVPMVCSVLIIFQRFAPIFK